MGRTLTPLPGAYAIARLPPDGEIPSLPGPAAPGIWSFTRTPDELSVVCRSHDVPPNASAVDMPWCVLRLEGPFDLQGETGVIASVASPLADAGISVFAMATYDTDYVLVTAGEAHRACGALEAAGHEILRPTTSILSTTEHDAHEVARLVREALVAYRSFAGPAFDPDDPVADPAVLAERLRRPGTRSFVARDKDGILVGVAGMITTAEQHLNHVWQVFVDPAHQGTGVADQLLDRLVDAARLDRRSQLQLYVADGARQARAFCARRGWVPEPDGEPGPRGLPVTRFVLAL